jgi:hypothetical protein
MNLTIYTDDMGKSFPAVVFGDDEKAMADAAHFRKQFGWELWTEVQGDGGYVLYQGIHVVNTASYVVLDPATMDGVAMFRNTHPHSIPLQDDDDQSEKDE